MRSAAPPVLALGSLGLLLLAGCSGGGSPAQDPEDGFAGLGLKATSTTGILRGIVLDERIVPVEGANVSLSPEPREAQTDDQGRFGFNGLRPGAYIVHVSKPGHLPIQQATGVSAGVDEPPLVQVLLERDVESLPYFQGSVWDGFIECGLNILPLCATPNLIMQIAGLGNLTTDRWAGVVPIDPEPLLVQSEMVWDANGPSDRMRFDHSRWNRTNQEYGGTCDCEVEGTSPLLLASNATVARENTWGRSADLMLRVYSGGIDGTSNPFDPDGCWAPTPSACRGVGYAIQQNFQVFTHVFHRFTPPDGWRFTVDGPPDVPD